MQQLREHFKDKDGRSPLFTSVMWASEWEARGLPPANLLLRTIYCHLYSWGGSTGLSTSAIARVTHGNKGDHRKTVSRQLQKLVEMQLVRRIEDLWIAELPKHMGQLTQIPGQLPRCVNRSSVSITPHIGAINPDTGSMTPPIASSSHGAMTPPGAIAPDIGSMTPVGQSPQWGNDPTPPGVIAPPNLGQLPHPQGQLPHLKRKEESKKRTTTKKKRRPRAKSDRVVVVADFSQFNPLAIFESEPHWLTVSLEPPEDEKDFETWLSFAADCATWTQVTKGKELDSPTAYAASCRRKFRDNVQFAWEAIQAALELSQTKHEKAKANAEQLSQRSQNAMPRVPEYQVGVDGSDDFETWVSETVPEFSQRLSAFFEAAQGSMRSVLEPHEQRVNRIIANVNARLERIENPRAIWGSKAQGVGELHSALVRARKELEAANA